MPANYFTIFCVAFLSSTRRQQLNQFDRDELREELRELADRVFDEHERVVPPLNKQIWKIDREIRKILLDQVLLYELEVQEKAAPPELYRHILKWHLAMKSTAARDPGSKNRTAGADTRNFCRRRDDEDQRANRSRRCRTDQTLIAYDYKLSTGSSKEDIKAGRSLQLPIYLEALEKLIFPDQQIAGGGYYMIRGGDERRNRGLHRASACSYSGISTRAGAVIVRR